MMNRLFRLFRKKKDSGVDDELKQLEDQFKQWTETTKAEKSPETPIQPPQIHGSYQNPIIMYNGATGYSVSTSSPLFSPSTTRQVHFAQATGSFFIQPQDYEEQVKEMKKKVMKEDEDK